MKLPVWYDNTVTLHFTRLQSTVWRQPLVSVTAWWWQQTYNKSAQSNLGRGPRRGAVAHVRPIKALLVTMAHPKFAPKSTPPRGPIPKSHYTCMPQPWTRPTYDAKRHPDPMRRFSTMHWTDKPTDRCTYVRTDRPTDRPQESLTTIGRCATRATRPKKCLRYYATRYANMCNRVKN